MKIIVTESEDFSNTALQHLSGLGEVILLDISNRAVLLEKTKDADILFVRLRFYIDKEIIDNAPNLKFILTATTGLDHIDTEYFENKGGKVISLREEYEFLNTIPSTAEHTWGLLLALMRNTTKAFDDVKNGFWRRDLFKGNNLKGKKIGILGLGRVGGQIAEYATVFGMSVGYFDTDKKGNGYNSFENPENLFEWADIISIHIPLNEKNIRFVNKNVLDNLKESAVLINTSRGAVVDEKYLCNLIENKKIKGYATDVLENELNEEIHKNQLVNLAKQGYNIIITPHIAGATFESMEMTENFVTEKFVKLNQF